MDKTIQPTRRDKRVLARRTEILDAAGKLFAEKGYHRTTTRDIAEAADVSEGTIYNYFERKEDLLMGLMEQLTDRMHIEEMLQESLPEDPRGFLLAVLHNRQEFLQESGIMLQAILSEILVNPELARQYYQELILPTQDRLEQHLQARINLTQLRPIDASKLARILIAIFSGLFLLQIVGDTSIWTDWESLADILTEILFEGVSVKE